MRLWAEQLTRGKWRGDYSDTILAFFLSERTNVANVFVEWSQDDLTDLKCSRLEGSVGGALQTQRGLCEGNGAKFLAASSLV